MNIKNVGVVGPGMIGNSLAAMMLGNSCNVVLVGRSEERLAHAKNEVAGIFDQLIEKGYMTEQQKSCALSHLKTSTDYAALSDSELIMESVLEDAAIKAEVYQKIEAACSETAIIGSATSAISAEILAEFFTHKERFLVAHPWNPPHMVPLIEIVKSQYTSDETVQAAKEFFLSINKKPVVLQKNIEGFVGNRLQHAMFREALYLVEQGIVTAEEVNDVVLYGFGPRYSTMKLFEHFDCAGLPLDKQVQTGLFPTLCNADAPQQILLDRIAEGKLGMKTGEGILDWRDKDMDDFRYRQVAAYYKFLNWNFPED